MPDKLKAYLIHPDTPAPRRPPLVYLRESLMLAGGVALAVAYIAIFFM